MNSEQVKFQINKLQQEKIVSAVESSAFTITCFLAMLGSPELRVFVPLLNRYAIQINILLTLLPILFWLWTFLQSKRKNIEIKKLEKNLK
jgi:hypothetical protein